MELAKKITAMLMVVMLAAGCGRAADAKDTGSAETVSASGVVYESVVGLPLEDALEHLEGLHFTNVRYTSQDGGTIEEPADWEVENENLQKGSAYDESEQVELVCKKVYFEVRFDLAFDRNLLLAKYGLDFYLDDEKLANIPHGEPWKGKQRVRVGEHVLTFYKESNNSVKATKNFSVKEDLDLKATLHTNGGDIEINDFVMEGRGIQSGTGSFPETPLTGDSAAVGSADGSQAASAETPAPTETPKPTEASNTAESSKPTEASNTAESSKPTEASNTAESSKPAATPKPTEASNTTESSKPATTPKPTEVSNTTESSKPATTPKPTEAPKPTETPAPTETPKPTETPAPTETPKLTEKPAPTKAPETVIDGITIPKDAVSYSTNNKNTVKNGNSGVYVYKNRGGTYDNYYLIDLDEGYVYNFSEGNRNDICERVRIDEGDLNSVVIITYHDTDNSSWSYGLHFKWKNQPDHLILEDEDGFEYDFYAADLETALKVRAKKTISDY